MRCLGPSTDCKYHRASGNVSEHLGIDGLRGQRYSAGQGRITLHPIIMRNLIGLVGVHQIVAGTDFPQRTSVKWPVEFVKSILLTHRGREMILSDNPARLLGIEPSL
jgi:predicted TIM-barrel fold metal-dependent hydrolase